MLKPFRTPASWVLWRKVTFWNSAYLYNMVIITILDKIIVNVWLVEACFVISAESYIHGRWSNGWQLPYRHTLAFGTVLKCYGWLFSSSSVIHTSLGSSTLMMLVAYFAHIKGCKKAKNWLTPWHAHGCSTERTQRELSNEYQHDRVWMFFKSIWILASLCFGRK